MKGDEVKVTQIAAFMGQVLWMHSKSDRRKYYWNEKESFIGYIFSYLIGVSMRLLCTKREIKILCADTG